MKRHLGSGLYQCGVCADGTRMRGNYAQRKRLPDGTSEHRRTYACMSNKGHLLRDAVQVDDYVKARIIAYLDDPRNDVAKLLVDERTTPRSPGCSGRKRRRTSFSPVCRRRTRRACSSRSSSGRRP